MHPLTRLGRAAQLAVFLALGFAATAATKDPAWWGMIVALLVLFVASRVIERAGDRLAALEHGRVPGGDPSRLRPDPGAERR